MEPNLFDDFHMDSEFTENYTDIWNDNSHQVFESELTNNLQGILPLFGHNNTHFDHEQDIVAKICQSENQYFEATSSPTVEVIQVDPDEYDNDSDEDDGVATESSYDETSSFYDSEADDKRLEPTIANDGEGDNDEEDLYSSSSDDENWPAPAIEAVRPIVGQKRIHRKSFSLPDSPVHRSYDELSAVPPSLTFEDLNLPKSWSTVPPKRVPPLKLKNLTSLSQLNIIQTKSKRQCVQQNNYKTNLSKPNLESDDSNLSEVDVGVETAIFSVSKRQTDVVQSKDNFKEDPTWSPTKLPTATVVGAREARKAAVAVNPKAVSTPKPKPIKPVATVISSTTINTPTVQKSSGVITAKPPATKLLKVNPIKNGVAKTKVGLLNAAGKYSKNMLSAVTKPLKPTSKLDHDYCTLKRQTSSKPTIATVPRKTIEIPIDFNAVSKQKPRKTQRKTGSNSAPTIGKLATKKVTETPITVKVEEPETADKTHPNGKTDAAGTSTKNGDNKKCDSNANNANNCPEPTKFKSNSCNSNETSAIDLLPPAQAEAVIMQSVEVAKKTPKKKLNLAEYKKRRDGTAIDPTPAQPNAIKCENPASLVTYPPQAVPTTASTATVVTKNETINTGAPKVKTFLNVNNKNQYVDPISAAQKKVLRQHALKKQAMEKSVEAQILKATPLLPILPLAELAGCAKTSADKESTQKEYEEIIVVSIACNTEVTIPINPATETLAELYSCNNGENISANSLLSSIQDVVIKKSSMDQVPASLVVTTVSTGSGQISPNIGVSPPNQYSPGKPETSKSDSVSKVAAKAPLEEATVEDGHGEDKVIMHLKKGRLMPKTFSVACQTVNLPQFPLLKRLRPIASKNGHRRDKRKRNYRVRSVSRSSERSDVESAVVRRVSRSRDSRKSSSPETTRRRRYSSRSNSGHSCSSRSYDRRTRTRSRTSSRRQSSRSSSRSHYDRRRTLSRSASRASEEGGKHRSRYHQHQRNGSRKRYRNCSTSSGSESSSYSSRSKSRSRSVSPKRRKMMTERAKSPDERRIVYVGRIENELTKDELKQKFSSYGDIKQVTLHFKDSGIRYGFVTFDKPQDAFAAIDASTKDTNINMYDISFGGRRQFCRAQYSDLDGLATTTTHDPVMSVPYFAPREEKKEESFEEMLKKLKAKMSARQS